MRHIQEFGGVIGRTTEDPKALADITIDLYTGGLCRLAKSLIPVGLTKFVHLVERFFTKQV